MSLVSKKDLQDIFDKRKGTRMTFAEVEKILNFCTKHGKKIGSKTALVLSKNLEQSWAKSEALALINGFKK
jgi:hypothetical protein